MITPSAAQAAGESTEQKIARLELELAAAQDALRIANASSVDHDGELALLLRLQNVVSAEREFQQRVKAQRDKARDEALEEAAKFCDDYATRTGLAGNVRDCAAAIRAMKECGK